MQSNQEWTHMDSNISTGFLKKCYIRAEMYKTKTKLNTKDKLDPTEDKHSIFTVGYK